MDVAGWRARKRPPSAVVHTVRKLFVIPAVLVAAALAGGCSDDTSAAKQRPADPPAGPAAETDHGGAAAGTPDRPHEGNGGKEPSSAQEDTGRAGSKRNGSERAAKTEPPTAGRKPTAEQIAAAIQNQGEQQVDDLSPRMRRLREIGSARQGEQQKPRQLSPEEQRAFEIGTQSPEYQNYP